MRKSEQILTFNNLKSILIYKLLHRMSLILDYFLTIILMLLSFFLLLWQGGDFGRMSDMWFYGPFKYFSHFLLIREIGKIAVNWWYWWKKSLPEYYFRVSNPSLPVLESRVSTPNPSLVTEGIICNRPGNWEEAMVPNKWLTYGTIFFLLLTHNQSSPQQQQ